MGRTVCFGEIMGRLNPEGHLRIVQATKYEISFAGGEANVAVSLSNYGIDAAFITKLPKNDLGRAAANDLRKFGVDISQIVYGGDRFGLYFVEKGASQRASKVIYDRKHSAIATAQRSDFDWDKIFEDTDWFHFTGITPALGDNVAEICLDACKKARQLGITVSCDLNFRKNLWSSEKACEVMSGLMKYVNVCISNEEDAYDVFGIRAAETDLTSGSLDHENYIDVAKQMTDRFGFDAVAITLRTSISASDNDWAGMLYMDGKTYFSKNYSIHIVDRVGSGDSFGAALIYAFQSKLPLQESVEFATAASCLKHSIEFDFNHVTEEEVRKLMEGDGSGRVQR